MSIIRRADRASREREQQDLLYYIYLVALFTELASARDVLGDGGIKWQP